MPMHLKKEVAKPKWGKKKEKTSRRGLELHLNGGATPAEVIMVESWDGETTKRLRNMAQMESAMRFSKVIIKRHTEKSKSWITSRLPFFIEVLASSVFEVTNAFRLRNRGAQSKSRIDFLCFSKKLPLHAICQNSAGRLHSPPTQGV